MWEATLDRTLSGGWSLSMLIHTYLLTRKASSGCVSPAWVSTADSSCFSHFLPTLTRYTGCTCNTLGIPTTHPHMGQFLVRRLSSKIVYPRYVNREEGETCYFLFKDNVKDLHSQTTKDWWFTSTWSTNWYVTTHVCMYLGIYYVGCCLATEILNLDNKWVEVVMGMAVSC